MVRLRLVCEKGASLNKYRIFETDQFQKDLRKIARSGQKKIKDKLREYIYPELRQHPHYGANIKN